MSFADLTSEHLSTLLAEVLNSSTYRENARKFQKIIGKTSGLSMAAGIVERASGGRKGSLCYIAGVLSFCKIATVKRDDLTSLPSLEP